MSFEQDFLNALYAEEGADLLLPVLTRQPGFQVYRNTVLKACVDALAANYPAVVRLVGEDWFRSAALIHARAEPPRSVCLIEYGAGFADFLRTFPPAAELPYLADVARLDRLWTESHLAADDEALDAGAFSTLAGETLLHARLRPRASLRWHWCGAHPAFSIWQANRTVQVPAEDMDWVGEGALLVRMSGSVCWQAAGRGMCAFLDACGEGKALQIATESAAMAEPGIDIAQTLASLIGAGAFVSIIAGEQP
ncbi:DNA-binding domain-containing protein [Cupriavidus oxalaticus]|uniref:DNA-binding domain-containing protein n=1 Tax=Cupriavidus oxalaticus TaxID=96344 RepID=UPI00317C8F7C